MKKLLIIGLLLAATTANAEVQIPYVPFTSGQDSVRSGNDQCSSAIDSPVKLDMGVIHSQQENNLLQYNNGNSNSIYARVVIPIDWFGSGKPKRLDCTRLYELQLREKELQLKQLELRLKSLENVEFQK